MRLTACAVNSLGHLNDNDSSPDTFEHFHDFSLVRLFEVPACSGHAVIVLSWLIAFLEYCFQVPANRIGSYEFTVAQLKTIQEVITPTVYAVFSCLFLQ